MEKEWIYYNFFLKHVELLDHAVDRVVTEAYQKLSRKMEVYRWFYIRYFDYAGPHIRLRFLLRADQMEHASQLLDELFARYSEEMKDINTVPSKRLIPVHVEALNQGNGETRYELSMYEPEADKYGGKQGVAISEELFQHSSELGIKLIGGILSGEINRFSVGLRIMDSVLKKNFTRMTEIDAFLTQYLAYWSGSVHSDWTAYRDQLLSSAEKRIDLTWNILNPDNPDPAAEEYGLFTQHIFRQMESEGVSKARSDLMFNYTHMMNNRLGIWPLEEAYLAALLICTYRRRFNRINQAQ